MKSTTLLLTLLALIFAIPKDLTILRIQETGQKTFQETNPDSFSAFLPLVRSNKGSQTPGPGSVLGVEASLSFGLNDMPEADTAWVRLNGIKWSEVEPSRGERNWGALSIHEAEWRSITAMGKNPILVVLSTPTWAQKVPGSYCGPIKSSEIQSFARFMHDLVARYSAPPYSIKHWELWNEPDVAGELISGDSPFGCWGDSRDPYYGGGYYAEMLKAVYPAVKSADPQAQVIIGGLLLDCDPRTASGCREDKTLPPKFLRGILENGGEPYFDGVGFHAYDTYERLGQYSNPGWNSYWNTTGPAVIAKARYVKEILDQYGVSDKYLICTETALMNRRSQCDENCEMSKAFYVPQLFAATIAEGIKASIWYSLQMNWRHVALFDANGSPRHAYTAYAVAWDMFKNLAFSKELDAGSGVRGYEFIQGDHMLWVLWSIDNNAHPISVPGELLAVTDVFGNPQPEDNTRLAITIKPVYVQWRP